MTRCPEGFIKGLCRCPECEHFDGLVREPHSSRLRIPCESCAGPMLRGYSGGEQSTGRICSSCVARVEAERQRREAQEAWLPERWWR